MSKVSLWGSQSWLPPAFSRRRSVREEACSKQATWLKASCTVAPPVNGGRVDEADVVGEVASMGEEAA